MNRFKNAPDVVVLGVDNDPGKKPEEIAAWMKKMKLTFPTLLGAEKIDKQFESMGYPSAAVIDRQGVFRYASCGYSPFTMEALALAMEDLRKEPVPGELPGGGG